MKQIKNLYSEFPAVWVFGIYASGIITGWLFLDNLDLKMITAITALLFALTLIFHFRFTLLFNYVIISFIFSLGMLNLLYALSVFNPHDIHLSNLSKISEFTGWISEAHYQKDGNHKYVLECESISIDSFVTRASGKILIKQRRLSGQLEYGDKLRFHGNPELPPLPSNPGEFNYRRYLQLNHIYCQYYLNDEDDYQLIGKESGTIINQYFLEPIRIRIMQAIQSNIPSPTSDVMQALILGEKQDIDRSIIENFQKTGIIHVLAISGLHVGFVILIFFSFFGLIRLPYQWKIWLTLLSLFIFAALVDFKAPVVRASIMAALYFISKLYERSSNSLNVLSVAGLIILFIQPEQLLQAGFQFSFAAVGAILYGYPKLKQYLPSTARFPNAYYFNRYFGQPLLVSSCAVLGTIPLTWWYYGTFQLGAFLINILIIPLIGVFVMISFLLITLGIFTIPLAEGLGILIDYYFSFILKLISWFAAIPYVRIDLPNPGIGLVLLTAVAVFLFFKLDGNRRIIYPIILIFLVIIFSINPSEKSGELEITFINVGQGDASLVKFPNGKNMLIDGGDLKPGMDAGERYIKPYLKYSGIKKIEYLVGTHAHSDHIGGFFTVLDHFRVDTLILPEYPADTKIYQSLLQKAEKYDVGILYKSRGGQILADPSTRVYVLHPFGCFEKKTDQSGHEVNNSSLVLKIIYGSTSVLFAGDLETDGEEFVALYDNLLDSEILKVGHHGSRTSTSDTFLKLISPDYSIISVGRFNRFFHPSSKIVERLQNERAHPLRTDHFGTLCFKSDGENFHLINWRQ